MSIGSVNWECLLRPRPLKTIWNLTLLWFLMTSNTESQLPTTLHNLPLTLACLSTWKYAIQMAGLRKKLHMSVFMIKKLNKAISEVGVVLHPILRNVAMLSTKIYRWVHIELRDWTSRRNMSIFASILNNYDFSYSTRWWPETRSPTKLWQTVITKTRTTETEE